MEGLKNYYNDRIKKEGSQEWELLTDQQKTILSNSIGYSFYKINMAIAVFKNVVLTAQQSNIMFKKLHDNIFIKPKKGKS